MSLSLSLLFVALETLVVVSSIKHITEVYHYRTIIMISCLTITFPLALLSISSLFLTTHSRTLARYVNSLNRDNTGFHNFSSPIVFTVD
jgi:hypothetical protein